MDIERKTPITFERETINDFQVFQMYVSELVNEYPYLQYLEDEMNKIMNIKDEEESLYCKFCKKILSFHMI